MLKLEEQPDENQNKVKWSLKAYKKYLTTIKIDSDLIFASIDDIIIKTIIAVEPLLWNGLEMFVPSL